MNSRPNYTNNSWNSFTWLLAAVATALTMPARAETPPGTIPFPDIGARATASYQGDALGITGTSDGACLRCEFQKIEGHATAEGLWLESTKPGAAGKLRLAASAICRAGPSTFNVQPSTVLPATGTVSVDDKLVRFTRPGLTEEYSVSVDGVRQDFIIESPPLNSQRSTLSQPAGDLRVELTLNGARAEATSFGVRLTFEGSGRALAYSRLRVEDATGRELTARFEVLSADRLAMSMADADAIYPLRIDPTFSDADWVSLNPGLPGANDQVRAIAVDASGNVYVGGDFTLIGTVLANHIAKWDGSAWSALGSGMGPGLLTVLALAVSGTDVYAGGSFITAGGVTANGIAKWNGSAWSALGSGVGPLYRYPPGQNFPGVVHALAVSGSNLYAGGYFDKAGGVSATNIAKWDGSAWSALGLGINGGVSALVVSGPNLYAGGNFNIVVGGVWANDIAKWNGSAWSALGWGMNGGVGALAVSGTDLYAGGHFTTAGGVTASNIAKWNGSAWSPLGSGISDSSFADVLALVVSGTDLYAGGEFSTAGGVTANGIAKWDGNAWSALGSEANFARALAVSGTNLYVGGSVTTAGGVEADEIAKWDGRAWSALGSGINGGISALAVSGSTLYAGGTFSTAGRVMANHIAKWDGSAWSALGSGINGTVQALAASETDLYAGGQFTTAGGVTASNIAKWNGNAWSALSSGISGGVAPYTGVYALAVSGTALYAGGAFTTAGGVSASNIAKWDGSAWSALGSGMGGGPYPYPFVYALAVSGSNLYAAGGFTTAGGVPANLIAKWDGSTWSALGAGVSDGSLASALAVSGTTLYAAGKFTGAGGVPANHIAKWDGNAWSALGAGLGDSNPYAYVLAVHGTTLYAAGGFTTAAGEAANCIAKWDGSAWSALGSGMSGGPSVGVSALAADRTGHLFVGGGFYVAGTNLSPFIAQANFIPPEGAIQNIRLGPGIVTLDLLGLPGSVYALQRATDVRFTHNLATLLTTNAPSPSGLCCYTDTRPPSTAAFYRLQRQ